MPIVAHRLAAIVLMPRLRGPRLPIVAATRRLHAPIRRQAALTPLLAAATAAEVRMPAPHRMVAEHLTAVAAAVVTLTDKK